MREMAAAQSGAAQERTAMRAQSDYQDTKEEKVSIHESMFSFRGIDNSLFLLLQESKNQKLNSTFSVPKTYRQSFPAYRKNRA